VRTVDLRRQHLTIDELLRSVGNDVIRVTSKDGEEFVLEAADAFEREARELGQSAKFMEFLAGRAAEPGIVPLAEIEARLAVANPANGSPADKAEPCDDAPGESL
jgi:hypothetical protein